MRFPPSAGHFILASLPLAAVMAAIFTVWGSESDMLWAFRVHKSEHETARRIMFLITDYANLLIYVLYLAGLVWGVKKNRREVVRMTVGFALIQFAVCFGVVTLVKVALGRPRPMADGGFYNMLSFDHFYHSLPSGHTAEIYGAVTPLALWFRRKPLTLLLGLAAALVAFSRIYLYQHYPSDVAFGWLFGGYAGSATFAYWLHVQRTVKPGQVNR